MRKACGDEHAAEPLRSTQNLIEPMIQTLEWTDKGVRFIDQTKLPTEETYVTCKNYEQVADAIRNMVVRGAPAIGVAAAMGIALGIKTRKPKPEASSSAISTRFAKSSAKRVPPR
jgi:methylthioribose-1-phosphate isomerase